MDERSSYVISALLCIKLNGQVMGFCVDVFAGLRKAQYLGWEGKGGERKGRKGERNGRG